MVKNINDPEYTKKIIENAEEYGIYAYSENELKAIIELMKSINNQGQMNEMLESTEKELDKYSDFADLAIKTNNPEYAKSLIENRMEYILSGREIVKLIKFINDPEYTKKIIEKVDEYVFFSREIVELVKSINDSEYTKKIIENAEKYNFISGEIVELVKIINDPEYTKTIIENWKQYGFNIYDIRELAKSIDYTKELIENWKQYGIDKDTVYLLILDIDNEEYIKTIIDKSIEHPEQYSLAEYQKECLIRRKINDKNLLKEVLINRKKYGLNIEITVELIVDKYPKDEIFELLDKETSEFYRETYASIEFIKTNLSKFIKIENEKISKEVLLKMTEKNEGILKGNFDILDEKYINILGVEKINQISCYSDIVKKILKLNDEELQLLSKVLDEYIKISKGEEWTPLANRILENIASYKELISNLKGKENIEIDKLIPILIHQNSFDIRTIEDVENYQDIKRKRCEQLIKGKDLEDKQKAVLLKIFGQGIKETEDVIAKFGEDIDEIEDENLKAYIKSLQTILKIKDSKVLEEIYEQVEELEIINPLLMERLLKTEYCKLYNKGLFDVKNAKKIPSEENVYSAGIDFKMIITSVGAYYTNKIKDYNKDWNRPSISSQHFCASYIRNDMLGHAPIQYICYGFKEMKEDSLMLAGPGDIYSSEVAFESTANRNEKYLAPNTQIAQTVIYNEMDYRRIQGGEKKQPDYIVVFQEEGKIPNMDEARRASKDFNELPIVVIDVDECLASERKKAEEMFEEYKKTSDPQVGIKLLEKLINNRVTDYDFCRDTDMDMTLQSLENQKSRKEEDVSMEDLEEIYGEVSGKERQEETGEIRRLYQELRNILNIKNNNDAR